MAELQYRNICYCDVPGSLDNVSIVAQRLKEFCETRLIDPTLWQTLEVGFCEGLNNAIEHGCHEDPDKIVKVSWSWDDESLKIEIEDPGSFQEVDSDASLPENLLDESGRGCFLIDSIFDKVTHESTDYGHKLVVEKFIQSSQNAIEKLEEVFETLQSVTGELNQSYVETATLHGFAEDLSGEPSLTQAIEQSLKRLKSAFTLTQASVWVHQDGRLVDSLDLDRASLSEVCNSTLLIVQSFRDQSERIIADCGELDKDDPLYSDSLGALLTPITYHNDCVGVIAIQLPKEDIGQFETSISRIVRIYSSMLALSIVNASTIDEKKENERSRTQLKIASEIQRSLLPSTFPSNTHCHITGKCVTAQAVGGDYIDAIEIKGHGILLIIADVMGKGVPAALLATIFRTAIRSRLNLAETPGWLLSQINKQTHAELGHLNMFITAQAAYFDYETLRLKLASAGHCPAFYTKNGEREAEEIFAEGIPLGIDPDDIYEESLIKLASGDRVLFITDGIYESENQSGEMLGIDGFSKRLPEIWQEGIEAVPDNALSVVAAFSQGGASQDDKTLMALEVL